ncbi:hypothetical protein PMIN04_004999 [Paraphaeosphaeria minitans]|uniref:Uncharacterized protein n=1 Tax=Paraphaeosphaeria minitans TaxID=565426 RepID=A0A9P6GCS5_9PLEO|nr:hypothetical protein PMIN01_09503 [Paraphaeosphaeria minitans]
MGIPGGVYICTNTSTCTWHPPSTTSQCIAFDTSAAGPPTLIGPDAGGSCFLYASLECTPDSLLAIPRDVAGAGQMKETKGGVVCPGIGGGMVPGGVTGMRCFALGVGEEEPVKESGDVARKGEGVEERVGDERPVAIPGIHGGTEFGQDGMIETSMQRV